MVTVGFAEPEYSEILVYAVKSGVMVPLGIHLGEALVTFSMEMFYWEARTRG